MPATVLVRANGTGDYTTIAAGLAAVSPSGTLYIGSGTYNETNSLILDSGGSTLRPLLITNEPGATPIIDGTGKGSSAAFGMSAPVAGRTSAFIPTFTGLTFQNWNSSQGIFYCANGQGFNVSGCIFINNPGTTFQNATGSAAVPMKVEKNFFSGSGQIMFSTTGQYIYFFNNVVYNCIVVMSIGNHIYIDNNTLYYKYNGATTPIMAYAARNNIIINATGYASSAKFFDCSVSGTNNFLSGSFASGTATTVLSGNVYNQSPQFVNSASLDFNLQATSPCINAGIDLSYILTDYSGTARSTGSFDIGALEYTVAGSAWAGFTTHSSSNVSSDFVNNIYKDLSADWSKRSGLRSDQNGTTAVQQVPFVLGSLGPLSIRGRMAAYTLTPSGQVSGALSASSLGY